MGNYLIPQVRLNIYPPKLPFLAPLVHRTKLTHPSSPNFAWHLTFDISQSRLAGAVRTGTSMGVKAPGLDERGREHKPRAYSVASPIWGDDGKGNTFSLTVKRELAEDPKTGNWSRGCAQATFAICE